MRPPLRTISLQQGTNTARSEEQFAREFRFEVITAAADEATSRFGSIYGPIRILKGTHKKSSILTDTRHILKLLICIHLNLNQKP
jgi:hypothetical protein